MILNVATELTGQSSSIPLRDATREYLRIRRPVIVSYAQENPDSRLPGSIGGARGGIYIMRIRARVRRDPAR